MNNLCGLLPNCLPVSFHRARVWVPGGKAGGDWGRGRVTQRGRTYLPRASMGRRLLQHGRRGNGLQRAAAGGGGGGLQGRRYWTPMMQGEPWLPAAGANHQAGGAPCELR
jgi:hypothetical protein